MRLSDTGGALAAAELAGDHLVPLPQVGSRILVYGNVRYDEEHHWYTVDPVDTWHEAAGA